MQHNIEEKRAVGVERNSSAAVGFESGVVHVENIVADGEDGESIGASAIGSGGLPDTRADVDQSDGRPGNRRTRRVFDRAGNAAAHAGEGCAQQTKG